MARIRAIDDPEEQAMVLAAGKALPGKSSKKKDEGAPPLPGPNLKKADWLEAQYLFTAWVIGAAADKRSFGEIRSLCRDLRDVYNELTQINRPGRKSLWKLSAEERRAAFAAKMPQAAHDMLWAAVDELIRRNDITVEDLIERQREIHG